MKRIFKVSFVVFLMFGFLVSIGPQTASAAAWLSPEWFAKYYGQTSQQPTKPEPAPQPEPEPNPTPTPSPDPAPTPGTSGNFNYWTNPAYYYNKYNNNNQNQNPAPTPNPDPTPQPGQGDAGMNAQEKQLAELINQERVSRGLKPLIFDAELTKWARVKSQDMIDKNYFAHESPTYGKVSDMLKNGGVSFKYAGENLGKTGSVTSAHTGFMNSSVHRATLLNSGYTHVGIGIKYKGSTMYVTEIFVAR
ncbi:MAG: CAP domain-containing protein [Peptococcales bacterium]